MRDGRPCIHLPLRLVVLALFFTLLKPSVSAQPSTSADADLNKIVAYIHGAWDSLTRSTLSCAGITDTKLSTTPVLYLPANFKDPVEVDTMRHQCHVDVEHLPTIADHQEASRLESIQPPGLLYLPNKYVVPGGRFNEMYGWDSYFIIRGLLRDGRVELARGMVENFFFEIEHYGAVLNANRTYYLSRSQPPFLSSMVMAVHDARVAAHQDDHAWMQRAYSYVERDHEMWTREPHLAGNTGLSRYYDLGEGPAMEALKDEAGTYRQVATYFLLHPIVPNFTVPASDVPSEKKLGQPYDLRVCGGQQGEDCGPIYSIRLTPDYYKGDRSMRESGFDISFRFGAYGAATHHYAPVCLNSLLFKTERDLESMARLLGKDDEAQRWHHEAETRKQAIQKYFWDEQQGLFFDYRFDQNQRSTYRFATTFYPLWAGLATGAQARAVIAKLHKFEMPGGIVTSLEKSEGQWDYPYGWAPLQLLAIEGMRQYGYNSEANRVSAEFLSTVLDNFLRDGTIREKYNVVTRSLETHVGAGYSANVIGFGWTNGVFLELLNALPPDQRSRISANGAPAGISH
ncbi:MAG TPA: trehalase family glycosidase [Terriglobales bacterium]|nr:trehalase family glycosidase [Terriglobales bacterium]